MRRYFHVMGTGQFPIDMLRYDECWPKDEFDSQLIEGEPFFDEHTRNELPRTINLVSDYVGAPTIRRWKSRGWTVEFGVWKS